MKIAATFAAALTVLAAKEAAACYERTGHEAHQPAHRFYVRLGGRASDRRQSRSVERWSAKPGLSGTISDHCIGFFFDRAAGVTIGRNPSAQLITTLALSLSKARRLPYLVTPRSVQARLFLMSAGTRATEGRSHGSRARSRRKSGQNDRARGR
jgi:hypothetical protein